MKQQDYKFLNEDNMKQQDYKFLNEEDSKVVNDIIQSYFTDTRINKIIDNIDSLTLSEVEKFDFNYFKIFDDSIVKEYINDDNIFYYVDFYCKNNELQSFYAYILYYEIAE
ncbi:hypothetical protein M0Q97_07385 [Candidatus Dojkabacteria bacterium]|jgi:hypothetical protein|nr:hypothetical protein [Candidatus Dojkabacteria bacterium]